MIRVASFDFPESVVLAQLYGQALRAAGFRVDLWLNLGSREIVEPALEQGYVDLVPEYLGSGLQFVSLGRESADSTLEVDRAAFARALAARGLAPLASAPAEDQNSVVVYPTTAAEKHLITISDLAPHARSMTIGAPPECALRELCLKGLERLYGLHFKAIVPLDASGDTTVSSLRTGSIQVGILFSTDGRIRQARLVQLLDDKGLQPAENVTPVVRRPLLERMDGIRAVLDAVSANLTTDELTALNQQVTVGGEPPAQVAERWLVRSTALELDVPGPQAPVATGRGVVGKGGRRRRPSGEAPPLPRELRRSGRFWLITIGVTLLIFIMLAVLNSASLLVERWDTAISRWIEDIRTPWLNHTAKGLNALGSEYVNLVLRWAIVLGLIYFRRWRHLAVFVAAILVLGWVGTVLPTFFGRPRPFDVRIIGDWSGFSMPSAPVAALAGTLLGIGFAFFVDGRWKIRWFYAADVVIVLLGLARIYLGVDHLTDVIVGAILGMGIMVLAFRFFCPENVFPVVYGKRGRSAHLDLGGARGDAIRKAMEEQLGLTVLGVKPFGLGGSGGSTPMKLHVVDEAGAEFDLFGKLYAATHLRADRNYKVTRTILYGRLEDERPFSSVRHLVEYEDHLLRVMRDAGINVAATYGFVEITPVREYLIVTEFLEGTKEISDAEVDVHTIDSALTIVRQLWDAGLAHRDVKPANILVRDGQALIIDVAFAEIRPSPWRQAVDLANMMLVLGLYSEPKLVFERALRLFTPDDIAEAFAAVRGVASPTQLRSEMKKANRDLVAEYRAMAPHRDPIAIQRWSIRRIAVTVATALLVLLAVVLVIGNLQGAGLL